MGNYNQRRELKFELTIRDEYYKILDTFKFCLSDAPRIANILKRKYGMSFFELVDKDLAWLKED